MNVRIKTAITLFTFTVLVTACSSKSRTAWTEYSFNEKEIAWAMLPGNNRIKGQGFLKKSKAELKTCAGHKVLLIPAGKYAIQRHKMLFVDETGAMTKETKIVEPDPAYYKTARSTRCDAAGHFEFSDLPNGEFFVLTTVIWDAKVEGKALTQGAMLMKKVSVHNGRTFGGARLNRNYDYRDVSGDSSEFVYILKGEKSWSIVRTLHGLEGWISIENLERSEPKD